MNFIRLSLILGIVSGSLVVGAELSSPEKNFETLWKTFNERYAFFELRGVDWQKQYKTYRPKVSKETTDGELFNIMCEMLKPLKDGHVNLKAKGLRRKAFNPEELPRFLEEFNTPKLEKSYQSMVRKTLKDQGFGDFKKATALFEYSRSKDFGYLLITEFDGVRPKKLGPALDKVLSEMKGIKGLIIDIRLNPGGTDQCLYQIASRFADKKRVGHIRKSKRKSGEGEDGFSELKTRFLKPATDAEPNGTFTGPICLLTHGASYSAADAFAMVMTELPHVTIIGEPTNGIFSNMLEKKLPNGWKYTLSFQVYYAADKKCYEGKGIPVDIEVLNKREDLEKGEDPLIMKSIEVLSPK